MDKTILIVDDDPELLRAIQLTLEAADYQVLAADSAAQALRLLEHQTVHLILADVAMPNMNGYQLFGAVSEHPVWCFIPFIMLSARNLDSDIQYGKELGVDDYLIKPIRSAELLATVRGKLKRAERWVGSQVMGVPATSAGKGDLCFGNLRIHLDQHRVWVDEQVVQFTPSEFKLLVRLAEQPGQVVTHEALIQATHSIDTNAQDASRLLRPLIGSLRRKLGYAAGDMGCIQSIRSVGYQFIPPAP